MKRTDKTVTLSLSVNTHMQLKLYAVTNKMLMRDVLGQIIMDWINAHKSQIDATTETEVSI